MRQTGIISFSFEGDRQAAQTLTNVARTLMGRMEAYLAGQNGAKVWRLSAGVVIATQVAGDIRKASIYVPEGGPEPTPGYYFVYLFGSIADEPAQAYGWKVDRQTDKAEPIKGLPMEIGITPPGGGRVRCSADSHQHGSEIVVLAKTYDEHVVSTFNVPVDAGDEDESKILSATILVFRADPVSGKLALVSTTGAPAIIATLHQQYTYVAVTGAQQSHLFATQASGKYIVTDGLNYVRDDDGGTLSVPIEQKAFLFDTDDESLTEFDDEADGLGGVSQRSVSYAVNKVGYSAHHPREKRIYTAFRKEVFGVSDDFYFRIYGYTDVTDVPTLLDEWTIPRRAPGLMPAPQGLALMNGGQALAVHHTDGRFSYHTLNSDGSAFTDHWRVSLGGSAPSNITAAAYLQATGSDFASALQSHCLMELGIGNPAGSLLYLDYDSSVIEGNYDSADGSLSSNGAVALLRTRSDDFSDARVLAVAEPSTPTPPIHYHGRRAHSFARLLDGSRLISSVGLQARNASGVATYSDVPRLYVLKVKRDISQPWYVPVETEKLDQPIFDAADPDYGSEIAPLIAAMRRTDRLSGIAIFEPVEGRRQKAP